MVLKEPDGAILNQHSFKKTITIAKCAIIDRDCCICGVGDLSVEVDVVQDGNMYLRYVVNRRTIWLVFYVCEKPI